LQAWTWMDEMKGAGTAAVGNLRHSFEMRVISYDSFASLLIVMCVTGL